MAKNDKNDKTVAKMGRERIREMYNQGSDESKALLKDLFGAGFFARPTIGNYRTIRTYSDACEALGVAPVDFDRMAVPDHIKALMKLDTVSRALWGDAWEPELQAEWDGKTYFWFPWFCVYSHDDVEKIQSEPDDGGCVAMFDGARHGKQAFFGCTITGYRPADTYANVVIRLCQETKEKAKYFASTFADLWAEYLAFGITIKDRII